MLQITANNTDEEGYSKKVAKEFRYFLTPGTHVIQFSGESKIDTGPINEFWDMINTAKHYDEFVQ